jgi:indole-3-glycerol phosphate synthase
VSLRETGTYLDRILAQTARDIARRKGENSQSALDRAIADAAPPVDARRALDRDTIGVIAEIKRASPSKGRFPVEFEVADVARSYADGGASAISCLTDEPFFQGSLDDLRAVVAAAPSVPVLRKDFVIDRFQIDEARAAGASMVLLIVAALGDQELRDFREYAESLGMQALVEIHDAAESARAVGTGASLIGINNRNLRTFDVDLDVTIRLAATLPGDTLVIGESGIFSRHDVEHLAPSGIAAVLVGESLIVQPDRAGAVRDLTGVARMR